MKQIAGIHFEEDDDGSLSAKLYFDPEIDPEKAAQGEFPESQAVYAALNCMKYLQSITQPPPSNN